jgi:hypothetical protein
MRTDMVLKTRGYQPTLAEDLELFLQLGLLGTFANIPKYMTAHRIHATSENDRGVKMLSAVYQIIKNHSQYPNFKGAVLLNRLKLILWRISTRFQF